LQLQFTPADILIKNFSLAAIPQKALQIFDTLKKLEVQENRIETIREGDFEGLRNLDSLILAHNRIKQIPAGVFSHLKQLNSLELEGNSITYIDKEAFAGLEGELSLMLNKYRKTIH